MKNFILSAFLLIAVNSYSQAAAEPVLKMDPETLCQIRYHYYPNLEAYFDMKREVYIYNDRGQWVEAADIPTGYRGYSLYNKINVPINDYDDDHIVQFINKHKKKFPYNNGRKSKEMTASVD
ncbi:MAG: hypothetical protein ITG00_06235 [Flavobacterium sp.]|nr:hypothetical protein [Flavobacterium sp.]